MAEITSLRPGLWLVEAHLEDFDVRGAVVAGSERAVVWDTLARPRDMEGVAELVPDLPLSVVYSHGDWDHVWGTGGLTRPWEEVVAHEICLGRFTQEIPRELDERRLASPGEYDRVRLVPPTRTVFGTADPGPPASARALDLGGLTLELHPLPGHTPDTLVGFIPQWGILLAGDAVETPLPFLNPGSPLDVWVKLLDDWAGRGEVKTVIPAHGQVAGPELLTRNAGYLRALMAGEALEMPEGMTPFYRETHAANVALAGVAVDGVVAPDPHQA
jgi:glyoxylase-like metal-dependent hydrolase (beta-lactamase superfamily II)